MAQSTDPTSIYSDGQRRTAPPPGLQSGDSKDGHEVEHGSMFGKAKNKAKKLRDKVKGNYKARYGHPSDDKEEEEEEETVEGVDDEKPDENIDDVTKGMAGLGGLGTAKKDDRANQGSEKANKTTLGDILGKNDGMSTEETMEESEGPDDELRYKDGILTEAKENPQVGLSSFRETGQGRSNRGDDIFTTQKEQTGTDVGTPSIPQRAAQAMPGTTGGIIGLEKGNKQEENTEEKLNSSDFDEPPLGLKEVPKPVEEEFQSVQEKSNKDPQNDVGEGNGLSSNEKPTEEVESLASVDAKKASGLIQGSKDSLTSDQGKKDDIVPEEQSRENQDEGMQNEGEENAGQSYFEKLYAAKNVIASKLGYGALPTKEKVPVEESKEDKPQGPKTEEKPTEEVVTKKDYPGSE